MESRRVLGFWDLVLFHLSAMVGIRWLATAAAAGFGSVTLWSLAFLCFFLPEGYVIYQLAKQWPTDSGLYTWTRDSLGPLHGFICGWCYWVCNIVYIPTVIAATVALASYIFVDAKLEEHPALMTTLSLAVLWVILILNILGMQLAKWIQNLAGVAKWLTALLIIVLGAYFFVKKGSSTPIHTSSLLPARNADALRTWSQICFALAGFELVTLMGAEIRRPEKNIPRSIPAAGIIMTLIYALGTVALLVSLPQSQISALTGTVQAIDALLKPFRIEWVSGVIAITLALGQCGSVGAWLTGPSRLLYWIGSDQYLPVSLSKLHPRWQTPYISILVQGILSSIFLIACTIGSSVKHFYITLVDYTIITSFIPYVYLFWSYLAQMRSGRMPRTISGWSSSVLGITSTLVAIGMAFYPSKEVTNVLAHEGKMVGGTLLLILPGIMFYVNAARRSSRVEQKLA